MIRSAAAIFQCVLLAAGALEAAAADSGLAKAQIANLRAKVQDEELLVSFRLHGAFAEELMERLHSGMEVTFRHRVDMFIRRPFPLVPNKLLGRTIVETQVEYDSLTRQYRLHRRTENKTKRKDSPFLDLEVRRSTESPEEAVDWLTVVRDVPLAWRSEARSSDRLRVRVDSNLGRRFIFFVIPSNYAVSAELRLEF